MKRMSKAKEIETHIKEQQGKEEVQGIMVHLRGEKSKYGNFVSLLGVHLVLCLSFERLKSPVNVSPNQN